MKLEFTDAGADLTDLEKDEVSSKVEQSIGIIPAEIKLYSGKVVRIIAPAVSIAVTTPEMMRDAVSKLRDSFDEFIRILSPDPTAHKSPEEKKQIDELRRMFGEMPAK